MSLNRTLSRLFDEVRREARRNPAFADRLDAIVRAHVSFREIAEDALAAAPEPEEASLASSTPTVAAGPQAEAPQGAFNPVAVLTRAGADGLRQSLDGWSLDALRGLVAEHHLDPAGVASDLDQPDLVGHIVAQAQKRVDRDRKLFDY